MSRVYLEQCWQTGVARAKHAMGNEREKGSMWDSWISKALGSPAGGDGHEGLEEGNAVSGCESLTLFWLLLFFASPHHRLLLFPLGAREGCKSTWLFISAFIIYFLKLRVGGRKGFSCVGVNVET